MATFTIQYRFELPYNLRESIDITLDAESVTMADAPSRPLPAWTRLENHQCSHCPYTAATHPDCPVAANLSGIVERIGGLLSYEKVKVEVLTPERQVAQETTAQRAVSSLMGLVIAASDCPHTHFFKPMARFHLPFANSDETAWRAASSYLLAGYFLRQDGIEADGGLDGLKEIYSNMQTLNLGLAARLRAAGRQDSTVNAVVLLDMLTRNMLPMIEESLNEIRSSYVPYLRSRASRTVGGS